MSQKLQIWKNNNPQSPAYGKFYVRAIYDDAFITTEQLADFIQTQCTVKRSDCKAVLDELGGAMKHFFELGQKIRLDGIGIFKVGISSEGSDTLEGCTAASVKNSRVIFSPETTAVANGGTAEVQRPALVNGAPALVTYHVTTYSHPVTMLKDVRFELTKNTYAASVTGSNSTDDGDGGDGDNDGGGAGDRP
jgi:predicted histone-like DNA-binding protein